MLVIYTLCFWPLDSNDSQSDSLKAERRGNWSVWQREYVVTRNRLVQCRRERRDKRHARDMCTLLLVHCRDSWMIVSVNENAEGVRVAVTRKADGHAFPQQQRTPAP